MFPSRSEHRQAACLYANLDSRLFSITAPAKRSVGPRSTYFILKQLPILPPAAYDEPTRVVHE